MSTPKFERSIQDTYTITQNNTVGAEDRGSVAETGSDPYTLAGFTASISNLQELVDYCDTNSKDMATVNFDGQSNELNISIPTGVDLQVADGKEFKIILDDFVKARLSGSDITTDIDSGANKYDTSDQFSPLVARTDDVYYIDDDGDWNTATRTGMSGYNYLAIDDDDIHDTPLYANNSGEFALVDIGSSNTRLFWGDTAGTYTSYGTNLTNIDTTNPNAVIPIPRIR